MFEWNPDKPGYTYEADCPIEACRYMGRTHKAYGWACYATVGKLPAVWSAEQVAAYRDGYHCAA